MNKEKKQTYVSPSIEVMKVEHEGVMALSGGAKANDISYGGESGLNQTQYNDVQVGFDMSDMISDILTFEE